MEIIKILFNFAKKIKYKFIKIKFLTLLNIWKIPKNTASGI
jgi:hypothetical protein